MSSNSSVPFAVVKAIIKVALFLFVSGYILFISAGTTRWLMAWVYLILLALGITITASILAKRDPELLAERCEIKKGSKEWDKILSGIITAFGPFAILVVSGFNVRFGWAPAVSMKFHVTGILLMISGYVLLAWAMFSNTFFSPVIRIQQEREHKVVTGGPYRFVRHPGYVGAIFYFMSIPLMLGSVWAFIPSALTIILTLLRIVLEEGVLLKELPGYAEYKESVRYRLLPGIW